MAVRFLASRFRLLHRNPPLLTLPLRLPISRFSSIKDNRAGKQGDVSETTEEILEELRQDFRTIDNLQQDAPTQNKAAEQMKADLVNACIGGDDKTVQQIVRGNVGALTATDLGEALIVTCRFQTNVRDDIALLLIQNGADVNLKSGDGATNEITPGWAALHVACEFGRHRVVEALVGRVLDINVETSKGSNSLHIAVANGRIASVQCLLRNPHLDLNALDENDCTALHIAVQKETAEIVNILIAAGADMNILCGGKTPATALFIATNKENVEIAEALIAAGADVNIPTKGERPADPLLMAIGKGLVDLSLTLIEKGADVSAAFKTSDGQNNGPIDLAFVLLDDFPDLHRVCAQIFRTGSSIYAQEKCAMYLYVASRGGLSDVVEAILQTTAVDVNALVNGSTPLWWACQEGHADTVEMLIKYKADLHIRYKSSTCLMLASSQGHLAVVHAILSEVGFWGDKSYLSAQTEQGGTCLHAACQTGHTAIAIALLDMGPDIQPDLRAGQLQLTPLHLAVSGGHLSIVEAWGRAGLDLDALDANFDTALAVSCREGHWRIAAHLVDIGANMNMVSSQGGEAHTRDGSTILHTACAAGQRGLVKAILQRPEDVSLEARDADGLTALDRAWTKDTDIALMLIEAGAAPYLQGARDTTVLHSACVKGNLPLMESLILARVPLDLQDDEGATALHRSCELGKLGFAEALVKGKADVNAVDFQGATPLIYALRARDHRHMRPILKLLSEHGASWVQSQQNSQNALHLAARMGRADLLELSVKLAPTAAMDACDNQGNTPLHIAVDQGLIPSAVDMINAGANGDIENNEGRTAVCGTRANASVHNLLQAAVRAKTPFFVHYKPLLIRIADANGAAPWSWSTLKAGLMDAGSDTASREDAMVSKALAAPYVPDLDDDVADMDLDDVDTTVDSQSKGATALDRGLGDGGGAERAALDSATPVDTIEVDNLAKKWRDKAAMDAKARFTYILQRLATGHRSRALSKRLKGCDYPIFEAKFDKGRRILWTRQTRGGEASIHVWGVLDHDDVPAYLQKIDEAKGRLTEHRATIFDDGTVGLSPDTVIPNPLGNAPMKRYAVRFEHLADSSWTPKFVLSEKQQEINNFEGAVLLLGRSGTGKTINIADRMYSDRQRHVATNANDAVDSTTIHRTPLRQLFVCRNPRLKQAMVNLQLDYSDAFDEEDVHFHLFDDLLQCIGDAIAVGEKDLYGESRACSFDPSMYVTFARFREELWPRIKGKTDLRAPVVWTQITSFLKGSVEACLAHQSLTLLEFMDTERFGKDRVRLSKDQRKDAFAIFERYEIERKKCGWWDDGDRSMDLFARGRELFPLEGLEFDRVYVDEIQDYTQAEILLFLLAGAQSPQLNGHFNFPSLFLAGDPVQAVREGVSFRFEEVRGIAYALNKISGLDDRFEKALKLTTNYRSHAGILNCSDAILGKLFGAFPGKSRELPPDTGLFSGPRPAYLNVKGDAGLSQLFAALPRLVAIVPEGAGGDEPLARLTALLGQQVCSVVDAKGMEFDEVALVDFFSGLPAGDQRVWRDLFREGQGGGNLSDSYPQVEFQLHGLYVAITRAVGRLVLVESRPSDAGTAFFAWLEEKRGEQQLGEPLDLVARGGDVMTGDEWRARGIRFAEDAEFEVEGSRALSKLQQALDCFAQAKDPGLQRAVEIHRTALELRHRLMADETLHQKDEATVRLTLLELLELGLWEEAASLCGVAGVRSSLDAVAFDRDITQPISQKAMAAKKKAENGS